MNATQANVLQRMRLARRAIPRAEGRSHASALPALGAGAGARAARFASRLLGRYAALTRRLSPEQMVYPALPSAQQGTLRRVLHEHRHQLSIAVRLSPALLRWPGTPASGARPGARHIAAPPKFGAPPWPGRQEVGPPLTLLRLAGSGPGFDATGLPAPRMRTVVASGRGAAPGGEPFDDLSPVEIARIVREQGSLVLAAANPDLVQPLARRAVRIPMVAAPSGPMRQASGPAAGSGVPSTVAAQAVPRVVHRPPPATAEPDDDGPPRSPARRNDAHRLPWDGLSVGGPQPTLDPAHLNRLADQVVRVIDDRVIATRERMGRI